MEIRGVSVCQTGQARGHGLEVDGVLLDQLKGEIQRMGKVPCKLDHRGGIATIIGFIKNPRIAMNKLVADLQLLEESKDYQFVKSLLKEFASTCGLSAAFSGMADVAPSGKSFARCKELHSVDLVSAPATNPNGLFEATVNGARVEFETLQRAANVPSVAEVRALNRRIQDLQIRFARIDRLRERMPDEPSLKHDLLTTTAAGTVEGGLGILAVDPLLKKLAGEGWVSPFRKGVVKRVAGGAAIGGLLTGSAGLAISEFLAEKRRRERRKMIVQPTQFAALTEEEKRTRGIYRPLIAKHNIAQDEHDRAVSSYVKSSGLGAVAGGLVGSLRGKAKLGGAIGALAGASGLAAVRKSLPADDLGQRSPGEHSIEKLVPLTAAMVAAVAAHKKIKQVIGKVTEDSGLNSGLNSITEAIKKRSAQGMKNITPRA